ncbi:hypothetical protein DFH27DRAFT_34429 [Peziza echinospora]|nr:hypothetical protein DFH27DRAFT_34429 [Peziza echinospora]
MPELHHHHSTPPAWAIIGLISSFIIFIAHIVLIIISPFSSQVIGITYSFLITVACSIVVLATYYQRRVHARAVNDAAAQPNTWALQTLNWLGISSGSSGGSGRSQMSEGTRERLRIAGGGVFRQRGEPSVASGGTTLPPYSPRRPERTLSTAGSFVAGEQLPPGAFLPPNAAQARIDEGEEEDLWSNRPVTPRRELGAVVYA